ncbi:hypothetical protein L596_006579 [Steinernema carpocapsae]|uniref:A-kinase anchor protein 7-like phosphoesterase domain-containing protein n=1 Tax=Steinernema carpocapsae TaxID=34508 RepID=A0A4U8V4V1_STECR|nr:hypothetical protein L596_006579 [Steinernema carpocapsae]
MILLSRWFCCRRFLKMSSELSSKSNYDAVSTAVLSRESTSDDVVTTAAAFTEAASGAVSAASVSTTITSTVAAPTDSVSIATVSSVPVPTAEAATDFASSEATSADVVSTTASSTVSVLADSASTSVASTDAVYSVPVPSVAGPSTLPPLFPWLDPAGCYFDVRKNRWTQHSVDLTTAVRKILLGDKSKLLREIQGLSECKIALNREGRNQRMVVTSRKSKEAVIEAVNLLHPHVEGCLAVAPVRTHYTHFIAFPMNTEAVQTAYNSFIVEIKSKEEFKDLVAMKRLFYVPGKLHVTLLMLSLDTPEKIEEAKQLLSEIVDTDAKQFLNNDSLKVKIEGLACFTRMKPDKTSVVFANLHHEKLQELSDLIATSFMSRCELAPKNRESVTLHMTVANTLHVRPRIRFIDASKLVEQYADHHFGIVQLNKVVIYSLQSKTKDMYDAIFEKTF